MKITISGYPGAGKGELIKALQKKYDLRYLSVGDLRGEMAIERGMTIDEFNKLGEIEEFTDRDADEYQTKWSQEHDDFIIEGRLSYHFIHDSIKIFLYVDPEIGAKRIFDAQQKKGNERPDEAPAKSIDEMTERIITRINSDRKRYNKIYNEKINYENKKNYDIYLDTGKLIIEETNNIIIEFIEKNYKAV